MTIVEYVKSEKITQRELAERVGCTYMHLNRISRGKLNPSWKLALRIEKVSNSKISRKNWYK